MSAARLELIDLAVKIELECAALYEVYARCFAANDAFSQFWGLYAEAERYHAASIRIHQASFAANGGGEGEVVPDEARAFLDEIRAARESAERQKPTAVEALRRARWVEEHSAELHARTQFFRNHPELAEFFQSMAEEDRAHRDMLTNAEKRWEAA